MIRKLVLLSVLALSTLACSREAEVNVDLKLPSATTDPASLSEGSAEFASSGSVALAASAASCSWEAAGVNGGYAVHMLEIRDSMHEVVILLMLYASDSSALAGNVAPGDYPLKLYTPSERDPGTDKMGRILVYDEKGGSVAWTASPLTQGEVRILSNENEVLTGTFEATAVGNTSSANQHYYNLRGSFKAGKGE